MNIISWAPFRDVDDLFSRYRHYLSAARDTDAAGAATTWRPLANISETDAEYLIKAELPEVDRKDVHVSVENGHITISGERAMTDGENDVTQHRVESFYGSFSRSFALPEDANAAKISAESNNGVLKVRIPKTKSSEPKRIEIAVK
jgi:HSP20 family protein